jgi:hypothetical protein
MEVMTPSQFISEYFGKNPSEIKISKEFRKLKGSAEVISEKERQKREKELKHMDYSEISLEFGIEP